MIRDLNRKLADFKTRLLKFSIFQTPVRSIIFIFISINMKIALHVAKMFILRTFVNLVKCGLESVKYVNHLSCS